MVVTITSKSTKEEIEAAIKKLDESNPAKRRGRATKKYDASKFSGTLQLKEDPLVLQKKWRDEW